MLIRSCCSYYFLENYLEKHQSVIGDHKRTNIYTTSLLRNLELKSISLRGGRTLFNRDQSSLLLNHFFCALSYFLVSF